MWPAEARNKLIVTRWLVTRPTHHQKLSPWHGLERGSGFWRFRTSSQSCFLPFFFNEYWAHQYSSDIQIVYHCVVSIIQSEEKKWRKQVSSKVTAVYKCILHHCNCPFYVHFWLLSCCHVPTSRTKAQKGKILPPGDALKSRAARRRGEEDD